MPHTASRRTAGFLAALGEPTRIRLVRQLAVEPGTLTDLAVALGEKKGNIVPHLGVLRRAGVVSASRVGRYLTFTLNAESVTAQGGVRFAREGASVTIDLS